MVGVGGLPVGLIPGAEYEDAVVTLAPGDRLVLMSDGITECPGRQGDLGADGAAALLAGLADLPSDRMLEALIWELATFAGTDQFPDDVSVLVLDYRGPPTT
jgi:sigma-B regulation protein RsbU (phosphoserine phosphatase)